MGYSLSRSKEKFLKPEKRDFKNLSAAIRSDSVGTFIKQFIPGGFIGRSDLIPIAEKNYAKAVLRIG